MDSLPENLIQPMIDLLLAVADDKLMLGHRNSDWTGLGPILEEDIAFSSLAQDEIAHAQVIYELLSPLVDKTADELAYGRSIDQYRCAQIVELPDDFDWAIAIARQFFCDHFDRLRLRALSHSSYRPLADLSSRLAAEEQVHVDHVDAWIVRLGRGNDESKGRVQSALDKLAPLAPMLFEKVDAEDELVDADLYPRGDDDMFQTWRGVLQHVAHDGGLSLELSPPDEGVHAGRRGHHSEHLKPLLDEMCEVYRLEPGAAW